MFLETPTFPGCPAFGMVSNPRYSNTIGRAASGREHRNRNWAKPLHAYTLTVGPQMEAEIQELLEFWHALGGSECGFRFKDWADYKSCRVNLDPTPTDQPTELIPGSPGGYQLVKVYRAGMRAQVRDILKPIASTIRMADSGVELTAGQFTVDDTTGLVALNISPSGDVTWGGQFDVPVRFDSEFPLEGVSHHVESVSFALAELRSEDMD